MVLDQLMFQFMVNQVILNGLETAKFQQSDWRSESVDLCLSDAVGLEQARTTFRCLAAMLTAKDVNGVRVVVLSLLLQVDRYQICPNLSILTEILFSADLITIGGQLVQAKLCCCEIDL